MKLFFFYQKSTEWLPGAEVVAGHVQRSGEGAEGQGATHGSWEEGQAGGGRFEDAGKGLKKYYKRNLIVGC